MVERAEGKNRKVGKWLELAVRVSSLGIYILWYLHRERKELILFPYASMGYIIMLSFSEI